MTALADQGFLELGPDMRLEYRMIGPRPEDAPTIVMLHEGLGCVGLWGDVPDRLQAATGAGVFVYSRAGYGRSSPVALPRPLTFMHQEARNVLPKLLDAIGFRRGLLLGHAHTVWLKARPEEHMRRVMAQGDFRPMAQNREAMSDLVAILEARRADYARAEVELDTSGDAVDQSSAKLIALLAPLLGDEGRRP